MSHSAAASVVTIGNFDGVHLGHRKILELAIEQARALGVPAIALTFEPHPRSVLHPETAPALLLEPHEKRRLLLESGVDRVEVLDFTPAFAGTPPEKFFQEILIGRLGAKAVVVGYDFGFGKNRSGHLDELQSLCDASGVHLTVVPQFRPESDPASSSEVRQRLLRGEVDAAARLLGRPFSYEGVVVKGDQRGRTIGFPTANISLSRRPGGKLILPFGVYATRTWWQGRPYPGVTNVGIRPTFVGQVADPPVLVETHLFDVSPDLYGHSIRVDFIRHIRPERRFAEASELKEQITADSAEARQILG